MVAIYIVLKHLRKKNY